MSSRVGTRRRHVILAVIAAFLTPSLSHSFCRLESEHSWKGFDSIPVYLLEGTHNWLLHDDSVSTPWGEKELEWEVRYALEAVNDTSTAGHPPLVYMGTTDKKRIGKAIVIQPAEEEHCGRTAMSNTSPNKGQKIWLGQSSCQIRWEHWTTSSDALVMRGALLHELGHALGLGHTDGGSSGGNCADAPGEPTLDCDPICGVMGVGQGSSWQAEAYYYDDALGLQAIYDGAYPQNHQRHDESSTALSWNLAPSIPNPPPRNSFGGLGSSTAGQMPLVFRTPSELKPQLHMWRFQNGAWQQWWDGPKAWFQMGAVGAALRPSPLMAYGFFELNEGQFLIRDPRKNPRKLHMWTKHDGPGSPIFNMDSSQSTYRHGIDGTYDIVSGDRFAAWRDTDNRIRIAWIDGESDAVLRSFVLDQYAFDQPSISCTDTNATIYRCLVVYPSAAEAGSGEHAHITRWWQFYPRTEPIVNGVRYILEGPSRVMQNAYLQFGPVSVSYHERIDSFVFAWKNPGRCWYTAIKGASETANWSDERSHCVSGTSGSPPSIGAAARYVEALENYRP